MNIIIQDQRGTVSCRPDTSWERENKDLYSPDFVVGYRFAPVLFARICKAGKFVGAKFATRYYDAFNYGLLLYPEISSRDSEQGFEGDRIAGTDGGGTPLTIMDRTSFLPSPLYNRPVLQKEGNVYELKFNGEVIYSTSCGTESMLEEAIVNASRFISLRIGDLVAVQLRAPSPLPLVTDGENHVSATFCDKWLLDFRIK